VANNFLYKELTYAIPSTGSGQALRQAQDKPFDRLRTSPSTGSGQGWRWNGSMGRNMCNRKRFERKG